MDVSLIQSIRDLQSLFRRASILFIKEEEELYITLHRSIIVIRGTDNIPQNILHIHYDI
jgi:hypothetical protein